MEDKLKDLEYKYRERDRLHSELVASLALNKLMDTDNIGYSVRIHPHAVSGEPHTLSLLKDGEEVSTVPIGDAPEALLEDLRRKYGIKISKGGRRG